MNWLLPIFTLYLIIIQSFWVGAQNFENRFRNYTVSDGLPSAQVYQIIQSSDGYIWFGTDRGVVRYNGYEFQTFTIDDGLGSNTVYYLDEALDGSIWAYGKNVSLTYYTNNEWHSFQWNDSLAHYLSVNSDVLSFVVNSQSVDFYTNQYPEQPFMFLHAGFDGSFDTKAIESEEPLVYLEKTSNDVHVGVNRIKQYYVLGENYDFKCILNDRETNTTREFYSSCIFSGNAILRTCKSDSAIYFGFMSDLFKLSSHGLEKLYEFRDRIIEVYFARDNKLLIGTGSGLWEMTDQIEPKLLIPGVEVSAILEDKDGGLWVGTLYNGLYYLNSAWSKVLRLGDSNGALFLEGGNNKIIFADTYKRLYTYSTDKGIDTITREPDLFIRILQNVATDTVIFISSQAKFIYQPSSGEKRNISTPHGETYSELESWNGGFLAINRANLTFINNQFSEFNLVYRNTGIRFSCIEDVGSAGILLGTNSGVYRFQEDTITSYFHDRPFFRSEIKDILYVNDSVIVFGSETKGVMIQIGDEFINIQTEQGLLSNNVSALYQAEGKLLVLWTGGISIIEKGKPIKFLSAPGLLSSNMVYDVYAQGDSVWLATSHGIEFLNLKDEISLTGKLNIVGIRADNKSIRLEESIALDHDVHSLEITIGLICFTQHDRQQFKYRLRGVDLQWNFTTDRTIRYSELPAGNFYLEVSYQLMDGTWSFPIVLLDVRKKKPFWFEFWFMGLFALFAVLAVYLIILLSIQRVRKAEKQKMLLVELERQALQSQMNPHFIFNSLTSIQSLIMDNHLKAAVDYLVKFAGLTRLALDHSTRKYVALDSEIELIKKYVELERLRLSFDLTFEVTIQDFDTSMVLVPPTVIQPFVENAILHGLVPKKAHGYIRIFIRVLSAEKLECIIEDDGVGLMNKEKNRHARKSMGVRLIEQRLKLLLHSNEKCVIIEERHTEDGKLCGVRAKLIIPIRPAHENLNH